MSRSISLTVLTLFVSPAFSQFSQTQTFQRACDLRNCQCSQESKPYCGTNEITYSNICNLECAQRQCDQNIRVKFEGVCAKKYVHDDGSRRSQVSESRNNFVFIRPPVYRPGPESPLLPATIPTKGPESPRLPATIPTRRPSGNTFEYGTTQSPSLQTKYVQYGTTRFPTTTYYNHEGTRRPTNYFEYSTSTRRPVTNSFEYRSSTRKPTNYFEYSTSTKRPDSNSFEYSTTPRPYYGGGNIIGSAYGSNGQGNDQRNNEYNQNQIGRQYGDFYDYK